MESIKCRRNFFGIFRTTVVTAEQEVRDQWIPLSVGNIVYIKNSHH